MSDVIYENPAAPLPSWARWMAKINVGEHFILDRKPPSGPEGFFKYGPFCSDAGFQRVEGYTIPGPWRDSLRRIIRLSEPEYYKPGSENPHTDDEGRLPHDGGPMPEHVRGKRIVVFGREGQVYGPELGEGFGLWEHLDNKADIIAYRIVGESDGSEDREAGWSWKMGWCQRHGVPPAEWWDYATKAWEQSREAGDEPFSDNAEVRCTPEEMHRNELAARLGVPVPGMSDWLESPLREARRLRYQEAALAGLCADPTCVSVSKLVTAHVDMMLDQENDHAE